MTDDVEFCLIAEHGILESQALLLCDSIRTFAGRHANARISVISPRPGSRPSAYARERFALLGVDYHELDLDSPCPEYGTSFRVLGLGWRARQPGPPVLVQLDSDTVFITEPDLALGDDLALARPVDAVGMCTTGPHDPREALWQAMCRVNGVSLDSLPWVNATVDRARVRASYNGGLVVARRALFAGVEACFRAIVAADLRSGEPGEGMRIGAGRVSAAGRSLWGISQAALSIAVAKSGGTVRLLDEGHNVPLHLIGQRGRMPGWPVHLHYHWLFDDRAGVDTVLAGRLPLASHQRDWLSARLPLALRAPGGAGVFNHPDLLTSGPASGSGPACSVVMTAYNSERFLRAAVDSVLAQDFRDFELIVVDDASDRPETCGALEGLDDRIQVLRNDANAGTAVAANRGIAAARSDIIVRLDSDDIAEPGRVGRLVAALRADPELGLVGSAVRLIDEAGRPLGVQVMPETDFEIRWTLLFHNPFYHSAVAFRRQCFERAGGYRADERISQDHYLWFDMLRFCRARNLAEPLARYRVRPDGLSGSYAEGDPRQRTGPIREALWREIGLAYGLQHGPPGLDASALLRGQEVRDTARREAAAAVVLDTLARVLALRGEFMRGTEAVAVDRFARALTARLTNRRLLGPGALRRAWRMGRTVGWRSTFHRALRGRPQRLSGPSDAC